MAPKRAQPPPMALPTGTVFRKRQRKGEEDNKTAGAGAGAKKGRTASQQQQQQQQAKQSVAFPSAPGKQPRPASGKAKQALTEPKSILKKTAAPDKGKAKAVEPTPEKRGRTDVGKSSTGKINGVDKSIRGEDTKTKKTITPAAKNPTTPQDIPTSLRVIVGSYERLLYGFHVTLHWKRDQRDLLETSFRPLFSFAAHTSSISAVAAAGADSKWLATGAGDETVRVWDLRRRKEVGGLTGHAGTIHALSFPTRTYMLSADGSGLINLYRTRDWALLKTLRGHTGRVNACVAHPSGKVALSVGKDGMLRMWDLMRGKGAGAVRVGLGQGEVGGGSKNYDEPLDVQWSISGAHFAVLSRTEVAVFTTDMQKTQSYVVRRDDPKHKFGCLAWLRDDALLIGNEAGEVDVRFLGGSVTPASSDDDEAGSSRIETAPPACRLVGHENRVKAVRVITVHVPGNESSAGAADKGAAAQTLAVTASSDGKIRIFDVTDLATTDAPLRDAGTDERREPVGLHNTGGARLTCLDIVGGSGEVAVGKHSAGVDDDDDEADDDADFNGPSLLDDADSDDGAEPDLDPVELDELNALLDVIEEARSQGVDVDGLSDYDDLLEDSREAASDDDDDASDESDDSVDDEEEVDEESEQEQE